MRVDARGASSVGDYTRFLRPSAAFGAAATSVVGAFVGGGLGLNAALAACTTGTAVAAANGFNDIIDLAADRVNQPQRPLPAGRVSATSGGRLVLAAAAISLVAAALLGPWFALWAAASLIVGGLYSTWLQRLAGVGNFVVAALIANTLLFGAAASGDINDLALVGALEVFLFTMSREILKDAPDIAGDQVQGNLTIAARWGQLVAARLCLAGSVALAAVALVAPPMVGASWLHSAALVLATAVPLGVITSAVSATTSPADITRYLDHSRLLWATGLIGICLLAL